MSATQRALPICCALFLVLVALCKTTGFHFAFNHDTLNFNVVRARAIEAALRSGDLPMWDRLEGAGLDQWAEGSKDLLLAPLLLVLNARSYLLVGGFACLSAAIFGYFWFATTVGVRRWPAFAGAAIWSTNGFALWHLHELNQQTVFAWLPVVLGALVILETRPRVARMLLVIAAAVSWTYGRFELTEYTYGTAMLFALVWFPRGRRLRPLLTLTIATVFGASIVAWFLIPYVMTIAASARIGQTHAPVYLPWRGLLGSFLPSIDAVVASRAFLALIAFPACLIGWRARRWYSTLAAALVAIYVLCSYNAGVYRWIQKLPLQGPNWNVERFLICFFFGVSLLATFGLDRLDPDNDAPPGRMKAALAFTAAGGVALLAVLFATDDASRLVKIVCAAQIVVTIAILLGLMRAARIRSVLLNRVMLSAIVVAALAFGWAFDMLDRNDGDLRIVGRVFWGLRSGEIANPAPNLKRTADGEPYRVLSEEVLHPAYWANLGVESLSYYTPFADSRLTALTAALGPAGHLDVPQERRGDSALARVGNVVFVCTHRADLPADAQIVFDRNELRCYRRPDALPRVRLVTHTRVLTPQEDPLATISAMAANDPSWFDDGIVVEQELEPGWQSTLREDARDRATVTARDTNSLFVRVTSRTGTILTVAERFTPGWHAAIDGTSAALFRANGLYQAVVIPPGDHLVALRYRTPGLIAGALVSVLGLLTACVWIVRWHHP